MKTFLFKSNCHHRVLCSCRGLTYSREGVHAFYPLNKRHLVLLALWKLLWLGIEPFLAYSAWFGSYANLQFLVKLQSEQRACVGYLRGWKWICVFFQSFGKYATKKKSLQVVIVHSEQLFSSVLFLLFWNHITFWGISLPLLTIPLSVLWHILLQVFPYSSSYLAWYISLTNIELNIWL